MKDRTEMTTQSIKRIPYGLADYRRMRQDNSYYVATAIQQQSSVRDYLNGEKVVQGFLLAYLNVTHFFLTWSEKEMGGGFVDFYLEPFLTRYPAMQFG
jgi:hypothetical protein